LPTSAVKVGLTRLASVAAIVLGAIAVVVLLFTGGGVYTVHAHFVDAGQLVPGARVEVASQPIGSIKAIHLTDNNQADVVLNIKAGEFRPLHRGTVATIRTVGLAGIANRVVELTPGPPRAQAIAEGGVLTTAETRPFVDIDEILNSLDPTARGRLQSVIRNSSKIYAGSAAMDANRAFAYLNPAVGQAAALSEELVRDQAGLEQLISTSSTVVSALASRRADLEQGVANTATALRAIASERAALEDALARAPDVIRHGSTTLREVRAALTVVRPTLRDLKPVAPRLAQLLTQLVPTARDAGPVLAQLPALLRQGRVALSGLPALEPVAVPALNSATTAIGHGQTFFSGLRPYSADLVTGLFKGFGGETSGYYDANGHFARISAHGSQGASNGVNSLFPPSSLPSAAGYRKGIVARCPGGAVEPASDGSNPWIPDPSLCNPHDDHP
jgi:phospholipid/cholesterol/gamma-HCH transport system substrate-binding protein